MSIGYLLSVSLRIHPGASNDSIQALLPPALMLQTEEAVANWTRSAIIEFH